MPSNNVIKDATEPKKNGLGSIICSSWLNILLTFIPVSWVFNFALQDKHELVFVFSFLAIIPLAKLLAFATDALSVKVGKPLAPLLIAILGNTVELIAAIIAIVKCDLTSVESYPVLSNFLTLFLVLGLCLFACFIEYSEWHPSAAGLKYSLLTINTIATSLPVAWTLALSKGTIYLNDQQLEWILKLSRSIVIVSLFIYRSLRKKLRRFDATQGGIMLETYTGQPSLTVESHASVHCISSGGDLEAGRAEIHAAEGDEEMPQLNIWMAVYLPVVVASVVVVTAECLVESIDGLTRAGAISKEVIGIVLLPILGGASEHIAAVTVSFEDGLILNFSVTVISGMEAAVFVIPFLVTSRVGEIPSG